MATDAIFTLRQLRCLSEGDGSGHSEPYIWPVLLWINDATLDTPQLVGMTPTTTGTARIELRQNMRAGETVAIPTSVGIKRLRLEETMSLRRMILVVALWESDETPIAAVRAGYLAFANGLRSAVAGRLLQLSTADAETTAALQEEIKTEVTAAVRAAISDALSASEKVRVFLGTLNLDDAVGSAFKTVADPASGSFTLAFGEGSGDHYEIDGSVEIRPVPIDLCQTQADAVRHARQGVEDVEAQIRDQQAQLRNAPSSEKPFILAEIRRLREEDLADAQRVLDAALASLAACRRRFEVIDSLTAEVSGLAVAGDGLRADGPPGPQTLRDARGEVGAVIIGSGATRLVALPRTAAARGRGMSDDEFKCLQKCTAIDDLEDRLDCILRCPASRNFQVLMA